MFRQVETEQANDPEDGECDHRRQEQLSMMQERKSIVAEESDHKVVAESDQIQKIAKEEREPVVARDDGHEQELHDVQPYPDWEESAD